MPATDSFFRDLKKTHVVFAGSSLLLLIVWAFPSMLLLAATSSWLLN